MPGSARFDIPARRGIVLPMDNPSESQPSKARPKAGVRGWIPITIIMLAVIGIILIRRSPEEETMRNMHSFMAGGIAILLLLVWFLLLSRIWQEWGDEGIGIGFY